MNKCTTHHICDCQADKMAELERRLKRAYEELEEALYNQECDRNCQCCLNNKNIFTDLEMLKRELEAVSKEGK